MDWMDLLNFGIIAAFVVGSIYLATTHKDPPDDPHDWHKHING